VTLDRDSDDSTHVTAVAQVPSQPDSVALVEEKTPQHAAVDDFVLVADNINPVEHYARLLERYPSSSEATARAGWTTAACILGVRLHGESYVS